MKLSIEHQKVPSGAKGLAEVKQMLRNDCGQQSLEVSAA